MGPEEADRTARTEDKADQTQDRTDQSEDTKQRLIDTKDDQLDREELKKEKEDLNKEKDMEDLNKDKEDVNKDTESFNKDTEDLNNDNEDLNKDIEDEEEFLEVQTEVRKRTKDVDGGWAWMVLLGSFMNLLLASGIGFVSGIFQKLFLEEFGESVAFTAWVTALFSSLMQLAGPLSGLLTSVTNCRMTVMVGGAMLAGGLAASSFATSLPFLFVTYGLISGTGLGLMYTPSIVIVNFYFDRLRTVMNGLALSASGIGIIGSPILSRYLIDEFTWRETMLILACLSAHVCVFGALMFPLHEPRSPCVQLYRKCRGKEPSDCEEDYQLCDTFEMHEEEGDGDVKIVKVINGGYHFADDVHSVGSSKVGEKVLVVHEGDTKTDTVSMHSKPAESNRHPTETDDVRKAAMLNAARRRSSSNAKQCSSLSSLPHKDHEDNPVVENGVEKSPHTSKSHIPNAIKNNIPIISIVEVDPGQQQKDRHDIHFGSRKSLNKISHHLDGTKSRVVHNSSNQSRYFSAHNITNLHHHHHLSDDFVRSLLSPDRRVNSKGSKLDLRAVSAYSSILSLHSLGLPPPEEIVALSSDAAVVDEEKGEEEEEEEGRCSNLVIFKNIPFLFLLLNLFLSNAACGIFNIHLPAFSHQRGIDDHGITFALAMDGLALFFSRMLLGILGNDDRVDKLAVYFGLHLIASFIQATMPLATNLSAVTAFAASMGIYYGGVYALLTSLSISIVGLKRLAFAFGVEMICAGLGYLVAPPLAGWIVDETGDYDNSMLLGGFLMFLSSLSLLCLSCGRAPGSNPIGYHPVDHDETKAERRLEADCVEE